MVKNKKKRTSRGQIYLAESLYPYLVYSDNNNLQKIDFGRDVKDNIEAKQEFNPGQYVFVIDNGGEDDFEEKAQSNNIYFKVVSIIEEAKELKEKFPEGDYYSYDQAKDWHGEGKVKGVY
jgi:hypothetical protein